MNVSYRIEWPTLFKPHSFNVASSKCGPFQLIARISLNYCIHACTLQTFDKNIPKYRVYIRGPNAYLIKTEKHLIQIYVNDVNQKDDGNKRKKKKLARKPSQTTNGIENFIIASNERMTLIASTENESRFRMISKRNETK